METLSLDLAALRAACAGSVCGPDETGYDRARRPWNVAVDQWPAAVCVPADARDIATVLEAASRARLQVAVQGTGHAAATLGHLSEAVLLKTHALTGVAIDPATRSCRAGAGALWQDVVPAAAEHGLAPIAGSSPDVGVVGYTLGGGIGYLSRRHGLAANHVTAFELVTATGEQRRVTDGELFWALRGGGHGLGVVTAIEFELVPLPEVVAGGLWWPWERAAEILPAWRALCAGAPDELTTIFRLLQVPPFPESPAHLRGRSLANVQVCLAGAEADADALLAPLRALAPELDTVVPAGPDALLRLHGDPEGPTPALADHALLGELPDPAVDALLEIAGPGSNSPLTSVELRHLGGALAREPENAGALPAIEAEFALHTVGIAMGVEAETLIAGRNSALHTALTPWIPGRTYTNFAGGRLDATTAFAEPRRLAAVRKAADPGGLFRTPFLA
jgi:FAD/FMN-containing dehydrogenase